jgi:lactate dehydrogenase-like 2-hydroxyacid dehydrogenase
VPSVFVSHVIPDDILGPLREAAEVALWEGKGPAPRGVLLEGVAGCEGLLSMLVDVIDRELIDGAPELRVISQMAVGVDNIDISACRRRGILVGHTPDVLTETVADTAFALISAIVRRIPEGMDMVREGRWGVWDPWAMLGGDLHGSTLGIVGMGRIGSAIARRAAGFDMEVLYASPSGKEVPGSTRVRLEELLERADIVVLTAPLTPETRHLIAAPELGRMRRSAHLVNVARGGLVDTDALVDALRSSRIAGAALDVTDPEPLPAGHPLLGMANCLIVPHIGSASVSARRGMASLAVANLISGLDGGRMPAPYQPSA